MKHGHRFRKATAAHAMGAVLVTALLLVGCQPGTICDKDEYQDVCTNAGEGGGSGGGMGGGGMGGGGSGGGGAGGGMGGAGGGMGGMGGGGAAVSASTPVMNCAAFDTLGEADQFFAMKCGVDGNCHAPMFSMVWGDFRTEKVWERMVARNAATACPGTKMIDSNDWENSVILRKTRDAMPKCANGSMAGVDTMPPPEGNQLGVAMKIPPLTDAEKTCIANFVKAAAGK